ncbi:LCCL domain-containing protein [Roseococcus pinisoli]|nr:LCCL domain-containing protein [Roseococcus pinisoli]
MLLSLLLLAWSGAASAQAPAAPALDICPDNMSAYSGSDEVVQCACSAEATQRGSVWGSNNYTADSATCRAALHAGAVRRQGGPVTVRMSGGLPRYIGTTRNGISSSNYGAYEATFRFDGDGAAPGQAAGGQATAASPASSGNEVCPDNLRAYAGSDEVVRCACPAEATQRGSVWGTDAYTADSSTCRAALHAGMVGRQGGPVVARMSSGLPRYIGTTRNGISSSNYPAYEATFRFEGERVAGSQAPAAAGSEACPDNMRAYAGSDEVIRCACPAEATQRGSVWGTDAYTADSGTCRAALHAGAVRRQGGPVSIRMLTGLPRYVGTTRNGIASTNYPAYEASFRFDGLEASGPQLCPDNMSAYAGSTEVLQCLCTGEAVMRSSSVWGSNSYTADSGTCRAARHAGVVPMTGGLVELEMLPGEARYPGTTRNGVTSANWQEYPAGFRFRGAQNVTAGAPVQAPVAAALRQQGHVALYITFRTNSADLDISAAPVLSQVRDAMQADPALQLRLVGHTDNQGGPNINVPLSQRRARSVQAWLVQNGVPAARLSADGRGQAEPIAENTSEAGRSLNRRVEAVRID